MAADWTRDENMLLLRVWGETNSDDRASSDPQWALRRAYKLFAHICGGMATRSESAVCEQIATLRFNFDFIQQFDEMQRERGKKRSESWFALSPRQRKEAFRHKVGRKCTYIPLDYRMFAALEAIQDQSCDASTERSSSRVADSAVHGPLAGGVWTIAELVTLVQAWREIIDYAQCTLKSLPHDLNQRIYYLFVKLWGRATQRTTKAVYDKKLVLASTHKTVTSLLNHPQQKYRKWFSSSKNRKLEFLKSQCDPTTKVQVTAFDEDLYEELGDILAAEDALRDGCDHARSERNDSDGEADFPPLTLRNDSDRKRHHASTPSTRSTASRVLDLSMEHQAHGTQYRDCDQRSRDRAKAATAVNDESKIDAIETRCRGAATGYQCEVASELRMIAHALEDQVERIQRILHGLSRDQSSEDNVLQDRGQNEGRRKRGNDENVGKERRSARCQYDDDDDDNEEERHSRKWRRLRRRKD
ncbi:hypothetical protein FI667_g16825, partial [Globisporangium splendens]